MLVYEEYFNAGVPIYISHIMIFTFATSIQAFLDQENAQLSYLLTADQKILANEIKSLYTKRSVPQDDISVKLPKLNNDLFFCFLSYILYLQIKTT